MLYSLNNGGKQLWYPILMKQEKEGGFSARCIQKGYKGVISQGETFEETMSNISDAIELWEGKNNGGDQ